MSPVRLALASLLLALTVLAARWEADSQPSYTLYGTPGLIEMPTAGADLDGRIAASCALLDGQARGAFQATPRLSGTLRYGRNDNYAPEGSDVDPLHDRSFDLRYRLVAEGPLRPAVAVDLRDFLGTGVYSGEYLVAIKVVGIGCALPAGADGSASAATAGSRVPSAWTTGPAMSPGTPGARSISGNSSAVIRRCSAGWSIV